MIELTQVLSTDGCIKFCSSDLFPRKQASMEGMRSMDLPFVGEDEALSWCRVVFKREGWGMLVTRLAVCPQAHPSLTAMLCCGSHQCFCFFRWTLEELHDLYRDVTGAWTPFWGKLPYCHSVMHAHVSSHSMLCLRPLMYRSVCLGTCVSPSPPFEKTHV